LTALVPVLQASKPDITNSLKAGVREGGAARSTTRSVLLGVQAALAVVLLVGAGLFVRSLQRVAELPLGVDIDRVMIASIEHRSAGLSNADAMDMHLRFADRTRAVPGVTAVAVSIAHSFGLGWGARVFASGRELSQPGTQGFSQYAITPEYFKVMGIQLRRGREFDERDRNGSMRVAIVNETAVARYWPNGDALGQCVQVNADTVPCATIVGIVANARRQQLLEDPIPQIYRPLLQVPSHETDRTVSSFGYTLLARTGPPPARLVESVRQAIQNTDTRVPFAHVRPLSDQFARHTRSWTLGATMFSVFGALALILAVIGLYSVVVFTLAQRLREYGVRRALGASSTHLIRITVLRGVLPVALGIAAGLLIAFLVGKFVTALLFETSARDPLVLGGAATILFIAALTASFIPGARASRVDPMHALRAE
jgi:predicted permease